MLQWRAKVMDERAKHQSRELLQVTRSYGIPLIVNDHVEWALEIGADGVHLGQQDMHPDKARKKLGPDATIGLSIESMEELFASNKLTSINYVTISAVYPSKTKCDCKKIWRLEGLREAISNVIPERPVTAIGGINKNNVSDIIAAGASGVAVIGAIHDYRDTRQAAADIAAQIDAQQSHVARRKYRL